MVLVESEYWSSGYVLLAWLTNFIVCLVNLFVSLFLLISHDDLEAGVLQPMELSDNLKQFLPIEYILSIIFASVTFTFAPWYMSLVALPMVIFNVKRFFAKDHKQYFLTMREYTGMQDMEFQFKVKSVFYAITFGASLVFFILSLISYMGDIENSKEYYD